MTLVVEMIDKVTGLWGEEYYDWNGSYEGAEFYWNDGNMSCGCNRGPFFLGINLNCLDDRVELLSLWADGGVCLYEREG